MTDTNDDNNLYDVILLYSGVGYSAIGEMGCMLFAAVPQCMLFAAVPQLKNGSLKVSQISSIWIARNHSDLHR